MSNDFWENKIPCWEILGCSKYVYLECIAYKDRSKPCRKHPATHEKFLLGSTGVSLLIVAGSILLITSRWVREPLSKVVVAMRKVDSGDLDARVNITSEDELGKVAQTFNSMVETLSKTKKDLEILHQREPERVQKMATRYFLPHGQR
jgi:HAMP domain-containing protein